MLLELGAAVTAIEPFAAARLLPAACHGGCSGRRRLPDMLDQPDPYCPVARGDDRRLVAGGWRLAATLAASRDLPKLESACTTVVQARR